MLAFAYKIQTQNTFYAYNGFYDRRLQQKELSGTRIQVDGHHCYPILLHVTFENGIT